MEWSGTLSLSLAFCCLLTLDLLQGAGLLGRRFPHGFFVHGDEDQVILIGRGPGGCEVWAGRRMAEADFHLVLSLQLDAAFGRTHQILAPLATWPAHLDYAHALLPSLPVVDPWAAPAVPAVPEVGDVGPIFGACSLCLDSIPFPS